MNLDQANHIEYELYLKGLTEENIRKISADLGEPERMLQHRLKSLEVFHQLESQISILTNSFIMRNQRPDLQPM